VEAEHLSTVVGVIYDAAIDPELWPQALSEILRFVGGKAANFFWQDLSKERAGVFHCVGLDPAYLQSYFEKYVKFNPFYPAAAYFPPGEVWEGRDVIPMSELIATRFYDEWLEPQGLGDTIAVNLEKTVDSVAALAIIRDREDGAADEAARRRLRLIVPHMMRASSISHVVAEHMRGKEALSDAMEQIAAGVFLVDGAGKLVFANGAARGLLRRGDLLRDGPLGIAAIDQKANRALQSALNSADSKVFLATKPAILLEAAGNERWLAHVLPLNSSKRRRSPVGHSATAAIFVRKPAIDAPSALETVARLYKLTGGELRVLSAIIEIGGVPGIADSLGIAESTVRTHLKRLFHKTGAHRQVDLAKLVAAHSNP
jgi:DNA-binding CsgD family transcriptional regulator